MTVSWPCPQGISQSPVSPPIASPSFHPKSGPMLLHKSHELLSAGQREKKRILFSKDPVRDVYSSRTIPDHISFQIVTETFPLLQVALVLTFYLFKGLYKCRESMILSYGTHFFQALWAIYGLFICISLLHALWSGLKAFLLVFSLRLPRVPSCLDWGLQLSGLSVCWGEEQTSGGAPCVCCVWFFHLFWV